MAFSPRAHDTLYIDGVVYSIAEHPAAPGLPYGQEGRAAVVYRLVAEDTGETRAFKVFKPRFQIPALVGLSERLEAFANLQGLQVCRRQVITSRRNIDLVRQHPGLSYAVLMPWIDGPTWMEVLLEERALSPQQSHLLARTFTEIMAGMEERGVAHCDLSGPNVLLPALAEARSTGRADVAQSDIELVDVEQMFGEDLKRPEFVPAGSSGYAHKSAAEGLWNAKADRFAGALLIAEMLGWCDEKVRAASWGESYFDPEEMQEDTERYRLLHSTLHDRWGEGAAKLLEQSWESDSLSDCATFGQWVAAIPDHVPPSATALSPATQAASPGPAAQPDTSEQITAASAAVASNSSAVSPAPKARETGGIPQYIREMLDEARRFEESGNIDSAISTYREVLSMAPAGSGLIEEIPLIISQLAPKQQATAPLPPPTQPPPAATAPMPPTVTPTQPQNQVVSASASQPQPQPQSQPQSQPQPYSQPQPQQARAEVYTPPPQPTYAPQVAAQPQKARSLPILPIALVLGLVVVAAIVFFLLQPKGQVSPIGTPTAVAVATPAVTANAAGPTTVPTAAAENPTQAPTAAAESPTSVAESPTQAPTKQADNPTPAPTVAAAPTALPPTGNTLAANLTLSTHTDKVNGIAFAPDGQTFASASSDKTIKIWQASDGKEIRTLTNSARVYSLAYSPKSETLAAGFEDGSLKLWTVYDGVELAVLDNGGASVFSVAFSPDRTYLAAGLVTGEIKLWRLADYTLVRTLKGKPNSVYRVIFTPDGSTLLTGSQKGEVGQWTVADGTLKDASPSEDVGSIALSDDGKFFADGFSAGTVEIWDASSKQVLRTLNLFSSQVWSLAFSSDGKIIAAGSGDGTIKLAKVADGAEIATLSGHTATINGLAFSPDGKTLVSGSDDKTVRVWKIPAGSGN